MKVMMCIAGLLVAGYVGGCGTLKTSDTGGMGKFPAIGQTKEEFVSDLGPPIAKETNSETGWGWRYYKAPYVVTADFYKERAVAIRYYRREHMSRKEVTALLDLNSQGSTWRLDEQRGEGNERVDVWVLDGTEFVATQSRGLLKVSASRPGGSWSAETVYKMLKK